MRDLGAERGGVWIAACAVGWGVGMASALHAPTLDSVLQGWCTVGMIALIFVVIQERNARVFAPDGSLTMRGFLRGLAMLLAAAWVAHMGTSLRAQARQDARLIPSVEGREMQVTGCITTLPAWTGVSAAFDFRVESAQRIDASAQGSMPTGLVRVTWSREPEDVGLASSTLPKLAVGQCWRLPMRFKRPHAPLNPHGWDFELWAFEHGYAALGSVLQRASLPPDAAPQRLHRQAWVPVQALRQSVRDAIQAQLRDPRTAAVVAALAIGDQSAIDRDDWALYRTTGVAHLMSISGLHVTMFAWVASWAVGALWRRSERLSHALPARKAAWSGGAALAFAYAVVAGFGLPAQRTVCMLVVVACLQMRAVQWPWPWVLGTAALAVGTLDPWALLQPSFWLSFVAVGLLMLRGPPDTDATNAAGVPWLPRMGALLWSGVRTQWAITVGLVPLTLLFFHQVSVVGAVANGVAIPWVTWVVTPLALLGVAAPALWSAAAWGVDALGSVLAVLAKPAWATWQAAVPQVGVQVMALLGAGLALWPGPARARLAGGALMVPMVWPALPNLDEGRFEAVVLDVGQGAAVVVRTRQHTFLYDAGPAWPSGDAGERWVVPYLRAAGIKRLDRLVLSHRDLDHTGGADSVLRAVPTNSLWSSLEPTHALLHPARTRTQQRCEAGQQWHWDGVHFEVLHPVPALYGQPQVRPNDMSCVVRVRDAQGHALLLMGDLEAAHEAQLVARAQATGQSLRATVLVLPHHGSRTSSSDALLDAVAPVAAVAQVGFQHRFGHPHASVLARLDQRGIALMRSDTCGAWSWSPPQAMTCERARNPRVWRAHGR
jgi:competence protein ComEC